jgi:hypothetical protein
MINITKSQPAPLSLAIEKLKKSGKYNSGDVLNRLVVDFHNKCYICEEKGPSSINVEHFVSHKGNVDLMFDWNNLFFACSHCNNTKLAKYNNLIDCTDSLQIVVNLLKFEINPFPKEKVRISPLINDEKIVLTSQLLLEVYNGTTDTKVLEGLNVRDKLIKEIDLFSKFLHEYFEDGISAEDKLDLKSKIRRRLSPESAFTAFKIWIIKNNEYLLAEFGEFIKHS